MSKIKLKENEKIIRTVRRSLWYWWWQSLLAMIFILLAFFLMYPLFLQGWWGIVMFTIILLLGLWLILRIYLCYYYSTFIITNWRIVDVDQSGFFNQTVSESLYSQIEEVTFKCRGLLRAVMSLGDIYISFIDSKRIKIKLPLIKNPQHIVDEVLSQQELSIKDRAGIDQNAQILLKKIKSRLSKQEFNQLITD